MTIDHRKNPPPRMSVGRQPVLRVLPAQTLGTDVRYGPPSRPWRTLLGRVRGADTVRARDHGAVPASKRVSVDGNVALVKPLVHRPAINPPVQRAPHG